MKEFDMSYILQNSATLLIGQTGRGRHNVCDQIKQFIVNEYKIRKTYVITNHHDITKSHDSDCIFKFNNHETYYEIINDQSLLNDEILIIFDGELLDSNTFGKDMLLHQLIFNAKELKITIVTLVDNIYCVSPCFRHTHNIIFEFGTNNYSNELIIYNNYASVFTTFEEFSQVSRDLQCNYVLVIKRYYSKQESLTKENTIFYFDKNK